MRIAFTIIYNQLHQLQFMGFTDFMLKNFDHWVVVDGLAGNGGSTSWCKDLNLDFKSTDGTVEYMRSLKSDTVHFIEAERKWDSKDEMVEAAIVKIRELARACTLYQVDSDEHWTEDGMMRAERFLKGTDRKCVSVTPIHYVSTNRVAMGQWVTKVNRVWKWKGESFISHEPAVIYGQSKALAIPVSFNHYSYIFDKDIIFKEKLYGYTGLYSKWKSFQDSIEDELPITALFDKDHPIGKSKTKLVKI